MGPITQVRTTAEFTRHSDRSNDLETAYASSRAQERRDVAEERSLAGAMVGLSMGWLVAGPIGAVVGLAIGALVPVLEDR
jgi:F0F1-type ATP synthase assembly protein I